MPRRRSRSSPRSTRTAAASSSACSRPSKRETTGAPFSPAQLPDTHFTRFVIVDDDPGELPSVLAWEIEPRRLRGAVPARVRGRRAAPRRRVRVLPRLPGRRGRARPRGLARVDARAQPPRRRVLHRLPRRAEAPRRQRSRGPRGDPARDRRARRARARSRRCRPTRSSGAIATAVARDPALDTSPQPLDQTWRWRIAKALAILAVLALAPLDHPLGLLWYWRLATARGVRPAPRRRLAPRARRLALPGRRGQVYAQNQLTHLVDIKPGWFRLVRRCGPCSPRSTSLASCVYVDGDLGGITRDPLRALGDPARRARDVPRRAAPPSPAVLLELRRQLGELPRRVRRSRAERAHRVWSNTVGFP